MSLNPFFPRLHVTYLCRGWVLREIAGCLIISCGVCGRYGGQRILWNWCDAEQSFLLLMPFQLLSHRAAASGVFMSFYSQRHDQKHGKCQESLVTSLSSCAWDLLFSKGNEKILDLNVTLKPAVNNWYKVVILAVFLVMNSINISDLFVH